MPQCTFCKKNVPHKLSEEPDSTSICLDCLVEMRRFELQNGEEVMNRIFPDRVVEALKRLKTSDPNQMNDPVKQEQMRKDLQTVQEVLPY
jgi:hypothetical protein